MIESHLSKYRSLVPSLALIDHILDSRGAVPREVGLGSIDKAIRMANYLESHANRVYDAVINNDIDAAKLLADKILAGQVPTEFTARDVYQHHWSGLPDAEIVKAAASVLEEFDWLGSRQEATTGRTKLIYTVNPNVFPT